MDLTAPILFYIAFLLLVCSSVSNYVTSHAACSVIVAK